MRSSNLTTQNAGMTRLRRKGNADPGTLYECLNGYITLSGTIKPRPGTETYAVLPEGTAGLCAYEGKLVVFTSRDYEPTEQVSFAQVKHPYSPSLDVTQVHFAQPFMGFIYAVIEFEDKQFYHYWLEILEPWEPNTVYPEGTYVAPSEANGFMYEAVRDTLQNPVWAADVSRSVGERIEPTVPNGFYYECVATSGDNPRSGTIEPPWPTEDGLTIIESQSITYEVTPPSTGGGSDDGDRYDNPSFGPRDSSGIGNQIEP